MPKPHLKLIQGGLSDKPEKIPDATCDFAAAGLVVDDMFDYEAIRNALPPLEQSPAENTQPRARIVTDIFGEQRFEWL